MVRKSLLTLVMFMMVFTKPVFAWVGLGYYTHETLAKDAIYVLPVLEYPDLYRFEEELKDGSESEDAHRKGSCGGNVKDWWEGKETETGGGVLENYKNYNFKDAYLNIGRVCHLTQDQAVPAHAANIRHGFAGIKTHMDNFEGWAYGHYVSSPSSGYDPLLDEPHKYYQPLQDDTRCQLSGWIKPSTQEQYWVPSKYAPALGQDATLNTSGKYRGEYGGKGKKDIYCSGIWPILWGCESPEIVEDQIYMATRHSAGVFAAASRKLPPLVKDLTISGTPSEISFKILENRKQNVKIFITVDSKDGEPIIGLEYGTGKSFPLSSGTDLPWEGTYSVIWDGKLANGQYPSGGQHTLYVRIEDEDGNSSDVATHDFKIIFNSCLDYYNQGITTDGVYKIIACGHELDVYCDMTNGGWTIIDPNKDSDWQYCFNGWTLYAGGLIYGVGDSWMSWREWFKLSTPTMRFATSPNGMSIDLEDTVYKMTGDFYGCKWYNRNCDFDGTCHMCRDNWNPYDTHGTCPWRDGYGPDHTYLHSCSGDWWNTAPSIGANGTHCVGYK